MSDFNLGFSEFMGCRKTMPSWTKKVKVCSGTGLEGTLDDGHSWRKYGQKDILGAKFPRLETFFLPSSKFFFFLVHTSIIKIFLHKENLFYL